MRVTIIKPNVFNSYGNAMPVGSIQTVDTAFGASLVSALQATDTDGVLGAPANNSFSANPVNATPAIALALKKRPFLPKGLTNVQQVMATPPTVAIATVNPLAGGQNFSVAAAAGAGTGVDLSNFAISRGGNAQLAGGAFPDSTLVSFPTVSASAGLGYSGGNAVQIGVQFTSTLATPAIVLVLKGIAGNIIAKVNDQYTSLTPTAVPNNGSINYFSLTFASPGTRRIDFIADNVLNTFRFGGMFVATGDTIIPAQIRGPRVIILGDSFSTATGAGCQALGYAGVFAEYMGWDDVWPSGVGGTGMLNPGSAQTYIQRIAADVFPFNPDEVIVQGFFNDAGSTGAQIQAAATALINTIQANLPMARITFVGPYVTKGAGGQAGSIGGTGIVAQRAALPAAVAAANSPLVRYLDPSSLAPVISPQSFTLASPVTAGATSFTATGGGFLLGTTFQWPDGSRSFAISSAGATLTVDGIPNSWPAGTVVTQCPGCYLRGSGNSGAPTGVGNADSLVGPDGIHPTSLGHLILGTQFAQYYANALNS
jgi:hypothetical protein